MLVALFSQKKETQTAFLISGIAVSTERKPEIVFIFVFNRSEEHRYINNQYSGNEWAGCLEQ